MNATRKLALLGATALAALALTATPAFGQEQAVEMWDEGGAAHCSPCFVHIEGTHVLRIMGMAISICDDEFEAEFHEDPDGGGAEAGEQGHVYEYTNNVVDATCNRLNCNGVGENFGEKEWPIAAIGENGPNEGHLRMNICLDNEINPNGTGVHCNVEVRFHEPDAHHYTFTSDFVCPNGVQVDGQWEAEQPPTGHNEFEVIHL
jgi:hypothetical protein